MSARSAHAAWATLSSLSYRDESDALRERVERLEGELASANATIERLAGRAKETSPGTKIEHSRWIDGPSLYVREEVLPYAISEEGYEQIAELLRTRLGHTNVSQVGRSLVVPNAFSLTREDTSTRIRMTANLSNMAAGPIALGGLAALLGGLPAIGVAADAIAGGAPWYVPLVAMLAIPGMIGGAVLLGRKKTSKNARTTVQNMEGTFEAILSAAEEHRLQPGVRARVQTLEEDVEEVEVEPPRRAQRAE